MKYILHYTNCKVFKRQLEFIDFKEMEEFILYKAKHGHKNMWIEIIYE